MLRILKKKLGLQIFFLFLLLIFTALGSVSFVVIQSFSSTLIEKEEDFNTRALGLTNLYISNLFKKMIEYSDIVYGNPDVQRILNADWDNLSELDRFRSLRTIEMEFFLPLHRANEEFDSIWVMREGAQSFGSMEFTLRDEAFRSQELSWFEEISDQRSGEFHFIPTREAEYDRRKNPVFSVARWLPNLQIHRSGPSYLGIVVMNIHLSALEEALNLFSNQLDDGTGMFITDEKGQIVAHNNRELVGQDWSGTPYFAGIQAGALQEGQFVTQTGENQGRKMISYLKTDFSGWYLVTDTPYASILEDGNQMALFILVLTAATTLIAGVLTRILSKRISRPIEAMKDMMLQVEAGDLSARYHTQSQHEIGQLSRSLNAMMDDLERKTENLLELDRMKDEFLASTSHELRTPLNGIIGITEFLIDGGAGPTNSLQTKNFHTILNSAKRLGSLVADILDLSKIKKNRLQLQLKSVDLTLITQMAIDIIAPLAQTKSLEIRTQFPTELPLIMADPGRLEQIMVNLLGNAIKFTDKGHISVQAKMEKDEILVSVEDTGIGIPREKLETVFNDFEQVDASDSRSYGGTGLGLSITKKFVELHGGKIWCQSHLEKGSVFYFTLPKSDLPEPILTEPIAPQSSETVVAQSLDTDSVGEQEFPTILSEEGLGFKILAVDDEPVNLEVLSNHLKQRQYQVRVANSGVQALEILHSGEEFDLVILDIMMPRKTGFEVCSELRKTFTLFQLPVLLLTARNQPGDVFKGFEAGANDYLVKPFQKAEILARTKTMVNLKSSVQIALKNAEKLETERKQRELANTLQEANKRLSSSLRREEVLETLLEMIPRLLVYDYGAAFLYQEGFWEPALLIRNGEKIENLPEFPTTTEGLQKLLEERPDYLYEPSLKDSQTRDNAPLLAPASESSLMLPLFIKDKLSGTIVLESRTPGFFDETNHALLLTLLSQAMISLENASLFEEVETLASVDALTGVYNRRHFLDQAERELKLAKRNGSVVALILFDVDHFKIFNDTYGHHLGDLVLRAVAKEAGETLRETDILGRYGGEEFIILLPPQAEVTNAMIVAERVRRAIADLKVLSDDGESLSVTISLGVATSAENHYVLDDLIKLADQAMYEAKASGRNTTRSRNLPDM